MKELTQLEQIKKALKKIAPNVTASDRSDFVTQKLGSKGKVSQYLAGNVADTDAAIEMLDFFQRKIADRKNKIKELVK